MFKGPSEDSGKLGVASGLVYVAWPLQRENGFVRILRFGGELGWISEGVIRPLYREPGSKGGCTLSWSGRLIQFISILVPRGGFFGMVTTFQRTSS